jgi:adenosylmethionine-8-amino-7-oxononanoate aminotransferase
MSKLSKVNNHVWHPFTQHKTAKKPLHIEKTKGIYLFDKKGNKYIDCNSSWWVNIHGHNHPKLTKVIEKQLTKIDHIIFADATHTPAIKLAEKICSILPSEFQKVFYSDNGSTSVEVAMKMALQYWYNKEQEKNEIVALKGAYHGDTFGAMSVGERNYFNKPFENHFFNVNYLDFPTPVNQQEQLDIAEKIFKSGKVAFLILEPIIQGASGMRIYNKSWLEDLVTLAKKYQVLVIFDEVMTAWGRTGKTFAMDHLNVIPDFICLSKGLTGGILPLGVTVTHQYIYDAFLSNETKTAFLHGHSFTANPIACAVALKSIDLLLSNKVQNDIKLVERKNEAFVEKFKNHPSIHQIRSYGTILAFELKEFQEDDYFSKKNHIIYEYFRKRGLFIRPLGRTIYFNPPYCIKENEIDFVFTIFEDVIEGKY